MSKNQGGVATRPYKCLRIHVIGDNAEQCKTRLATLNELIQANSQDFPEWAEVTWNHGGGGGP